MEETIPFDNEILSDDEPQWSCPYCGDEGGEPMIKYSRPYLYGADYDGNRGEMRQDAEECCSKCYHRA
jgi:hypothetical protein